MAPGKTDYENRWISYPLIAVNYVEGQIVVMKAHTIRNIYLNRNKWWERELGSEETVEERCRKKGPKQRGMWRPEG